MTLFWQETWQPFLPESTDSDDILKACREILAYLVYVTFIAHAYDKQA